MKKVRKYYDPEFKRMAVELSESSSKTTSEVARELEVAPDLVCRWVRESKAENKACFSGQGNKNLSPEQRELYELKKRFREVELERDILKKAVSIFSASDRKL